MQSVWLCFRKAVRMELITEAEYTIARNKLMDRFLIIREDDPKAA